MTQQTGRSSPTKKSCLKERTLWAYIQRSILKVIWILQQYGWYDSMPFLAFMLWETLTFGLFAHAVYHKVLNLTPSLLVNDQAFHKVSKTMRCCIASLLGFNFILQNINLCLNFQNLKRFWCWQFLATLNPSFDTPSSIHPPNHKPFQSSLLCFFLRYHLSIKHKSLIIFISASGVKVSLHLVCLALANSFMLSLLLLTLILMPPLSSLIPTLLFHSSFFFFTLLPGYSLFLFFLLGVTPPSSLLWKTKQKTKLKNIIQERMEII